RSRWNSVSMARRGASTSSATSASRSSLVSTQRAVAGSATLFDRVARFDPGERAARAVDGVDAVDPEVLDRLAAASAGAADHVDGLVGGELAQPVGDLAERDESGAGRVALLVLVGLADVEQRRAGVELVAEGGDVDFRDLHAPDARSSRTG